MISKKLTKSLFFAYETRSSFLLLRHLTSQYPSNAANEKKVVSKGNVDDNDEDDINKPIVYSQTKAATYKAREFHVTWADAPDYHNFVISGSLLTFMIYFFILREPNDIDELFDRSLTDVLKDEGNNK